MLQFTDNRSGLSLSTPNKHPKVDDHFLVFLTYHSGNGTPDLSLNGVTCTPTCELDGPDFGEKISNHSGLQAKFKRLGPGEIQISVKVAAGEPPLLQLVRTS